ncbi:MAG: NB-ARC domain-containing protein [Candidatus Odinarchaeota archaeon]
MTITDLKINRIYGYDILINTFESFLREYISNEVLINNFGNEWKKQVPKGIFDEIMERYDDDSLLTTISIEDFFEELQFPHLKEILVSFSNYSYAKQLLGDLTKNKFTEMMDELYIFRNKIAHIRSTFSYLDLDTLIRYVARLCQGEAGSEIRAYLENEVYKEAKEIPLGFYEEPACQNNLPSEDYAIDGGFVGREKEIKTVMKLLKSEQDRIITITGAGGVGKTAIALRLAYKFLESQPDHYDAIIWFSAKVTELTDDGIRQLDPGITSYERLIEDMMVLVDTKTYETFRSANVPFESYKEHLYNIFSSQQCLIIIDNLETILDDNKLIEFIKDIPRPSQVLITSRKGMGEIERRYPISDMLDRDAIRLFRIIAKERNLPDLQRFTNETILRLVKRVRCYPLLIKWSIGQVFLGREVEEAFSEIFSGESEIAKFSFNDVFELISENGRQVLYSLIIGTEDTASRYTLMHLANLDEEQFEDAIKELILVSFVFPVSREIDREVSTEYSMLELTKGFVRSKLDEDEKTSEILQTRYYHLKEQYQDLERTKSSYSQTLFSLGIKTRDEQVAFIEVKTAKSYAVQENFKKAEDHFKRAMRIAPKLPYVLTEYAKFKYKRKHNREAQELSKKAVDANPSSFHVWFNYGIILHKYRRYTEAIEALEKTKQLNPSYLPLYNELGRVYSFCGMYEKATEEFKLALKVEKYPNYRHKALTHYFMAHNFRNWAKDFWDRSDFDGQIEMLHRAEKTILQALEILGRDKKALREYRQILIDLGIAFCLKDGYSAGKDYFIRAASEIRVKNKKIEAKGNDIAIGKFYLAVFGMKDKSVDLRTVEENIRIGLNYCHKESKWYEKLKSLQEKLYSEKMARERKEGMIRFYDEEKKFGFIKSGDEKYIFFPRGFREPISDEQLNKKSVTFILFRNQNKKYSKKHPYVAGDIVLID